MLNDALFRLQAAQMALADLRSERKNRIELFMQIRTDLIPSQKLYLHYEFLERLKFKEDEQVAYVRKMETEAEDKREKLLLAMKKKKIMDLLREKKLAEYLRNVDAKERRNLDELSVTRYGKRSDE